jgi:hypothetical protein
MPDATSISPPWGGGGSVNQLFIMVFFTEKEAKKVAISNKFQTNPLVSVFGLYKD